MPTFIFFVVQNPGEPLPWHYAYLGGKLYGGWELYEDLLAEISEAALGIEDLWVSKYHANGVESTTQTDYPAEGRMVAG